jgi:fermentation-respiration switch protein FrsA (DUF1100 family)
MHGNRDTIIPLGLGRKLFNAANEPKQFYEIEAADHNDTYIVGGNDYSEQVRNFVTRHLSSK